MMTGDLKVNSLIKFHTLLLLDKQKIHGYEIMKALEQSLSARVSASQVYPFLATLKKHEYVGHTKAGKRDKKKYFLTPKGKGLLHRISLRFGSIIEGTIQSKVKTCAHCNCEVYKGGYEQRIGGKKLYFCCTNCARSYKG